jgi:hypothetical protein
MWAILVGSEHGLRFIDDERQAPVQRQGPEGDDDHGYAQAHREDAVEQAEAASEGDAAQRREDGVEPRDHELARHDRGEVEHPADRQVDVADGHHEHHADGEHPDEGAVGEQLEQ